MGRTTQTAPRNPAKATLVGLLAAFFLLISPAAKSSGLVTVGSDLSSETIAPIPGGEVLVTSTVANSAIPEAQTQSPINGVIHSWQVRSRDIETPGHLRLRVLRGSFGVATGPYVTAPGDGLNSFTIAPQGLPIGAGDGIGVDNGKDGAYGAWIFGAQKMGITLNLWIPYLADNEFRAPSESLDDSIEVLVSASVEPDADGDRFGDESRDSCLGQAGPLGGCPAPVAAVAASPPETTIVKGLTRIVAGKAGGSARFKFRSSEAGAKFECALRRKGKRSARDKRLQKLTGCKSPKTYKRLAPGGYVFSVRAIGAAGPDPSPAKDPFRVVEG
jgi:hypothetical protein